jgi:hypothetical protein
MFAFAFDLIISFLYLWCIQRYTNLQKKNKHFICFREKIKEFKETQKDRPLLVYGTYSIRFCYDRPRIAQLQSRTLIDRVCFLLKNKKIKIPKFTKEY